jgi:hypothetical protein
MHQLIGSHGWPVHGDLQKTIIPGRFAPLFAMERQTGVTARAPWSTEGVCVKLRPLTPITFFAVSHTPFRFAERRSEGVRGGRFEQAAYSSEE